MTQRIFLTIVNLCLFSLGIAAQRSHVVTDTIHSKVLGAPRAYTAYLPPSFGSDPDRRYPVLYLLHGLTDNNEVWTKNTQLQMIADRMIRNGEIAEMVIVTPDADTGMGPNLQCGYFNMPGWAYEDFFFSEFMPQIEEKYHIYGDKKHRAVAGLSMGGGGATGYAQHHPEMFVAAFPMSALMSLKTRGQNTIKGEGKIAALNRSVIDNDHIDFVVNADEDRKEALRSVAWYIDCGDDDILLYSNMDFYKAMRDAGIPCELRIRDGVHNWEYWNTSLYDLLPFVARAFSK